MLLDRATSEKIKLVGFHWTYHGVGYRSMMSVVLLVPGEILARECAVGSAMGRLECGARGRADRDPQCGQRA